MAIRGSASTLLLNPVSNKSEPNLTDQAACQLGALDKRRISVVRGSRAMNCSRTTRSTTASTSRSSAISHLRQASRSCWAITKSRPLSPSSTERKRWRCLFGGTADALKVAWDRRRPGGSLPAAAVLPPVPPPSTAGSDTPTIGCAPSHTPPLFSQRGPRTPPGRPVDPSSSAGRGRWRGLWRGRPPGPTSSWGSAGLHPAPGPASGTDPPVPAWGPPAPGVASGEDQQVTSRAPQVAWVELAAWRRIASSSRDSAPV